VQREHARVPYDSYECPISATQTVLILRSTDWDKTPPIFTHNGRMASPRTPGMAIQSGWWMSWDRPSKIVLCRLSGKPVAAKAKTSR
jgi:hypothetical protein